ncbi:MAG: 30S ribosome-binding factor RbfA [Exilibacterium sp.]
MAREFHRTDRVADAVQRHLAQIVQLEIRDPRVGMVNINGVEVSRDLAYAKVFVTFIDRDTDEECEIGALALNKAAGYLRTLLAKEMSMRTIPRLQFIFDKTAVRGQALSNLIDRAVAEDRAHREGGEE